MTKRKQRKLLVKELTDLVFSSTCGEHYHTNNPPEWPGYIIHEAEAEQIRRVVTAIKELG